MRAQPDQPTTIEELQALLDAFVDEYNHRRPHRSVPRAATPAALFDAMPKALPGNSRDADTHNRIRHDRIDKTGAVTLRVNGDCTTSALDEPTPEPTSSCSCRTSRSASSTPSPANSYANSPSIQAVTTSPRNDESRSLLQVWLSAMS